MSVCGYSDTLDPSFLCGIIYTINHRPIMNKELLLPGEECKEFRPGYFITTKGRCYNAKKQKFMVFRLDTKRGWGENDYYYRNWIGYAHTLVGRSFLEDYEPGKFILHKDETLPYPQINYVENLWVGTNSDNMKDMWDKQRRECNLGQRRT
jgi:hypothetical protein